MVVSLFNMTSVPFVHREVLLVSHQFSMPNSPQQSGVVERKNKTVHHIAQAMLPQFDLCPVHTATCKEVKWYL